MKTRFELTDHLCGSCGGRVLKQVEGPQVSMNPIWVCAGCGKRDSAMQPDRVCWCGVHHRGSPSGAYQCVAVARANDEPAIQEALGASGMWPPYQQEVGVIHSGYHAEAYRRLQGNASLERVGANLLADNEAERGAAMEELFGRVADGSVIYISKTLWNSLQSELEALREK